VRDSLGKRLAKRHDALSLRALRAQGVTPEEIRKRFAPMWEPPLCGENPQPGI